MHILATILIVILFVFVFIVSILGRIIKIFMPKSSAKSAGYKQQKQSENKENLTPTDTEKYFSDKEGEYVKYEEIKEE